MKDAPLLPKLAIALASVALAAPAWAQTNTLLPEITVHAQRHPAPGGEIKDEVVHYKDLNINSEAGAKALIGRIRSAAKRACSPAPTHARNIRDNADYKTCREQAVASAVQGLNIPMVQKVYESSRG